MTTPSSGSLADTLYTDFDNEMATTRRMLERFPSGHNDWRPHEKSMTLGRLAAHVAELPQYGTMIITSDELDFATAGYVPTTYETAEQLLATFDEKVAALRPAMATLDSAILASPWTLRNGEQLFFTRPKGALIRHMMINHLVHHRAQLGVYYRMLGVDLPGSYGPSADEPM
jgi:uncharacterized damage-inducible protein DinB